MQLQNAAAPSWTRWIGFRVRPMGLEKVVLKNVSERNGGSLRINQTGSVDMHGQEGPWAQFKIEYHADGKISLRSIGHKDKAMYLVSKIRGALMSPKQTTDLPRAGRGRPRPTDGQGHQRARGTVERGVGAHGCAAVLGGPPVRVGGRAHLPRGLGPQHRPDPLLYGAWGQRAAGMC